MGEQVHWHEGLFLRPHHLQVMQRQVLEQFAAERHLSLCYHYGVIEARLSLDALENKLIQFDRLRAIMPISGLEVNVPDNADLPAINISQAFSAGSGLLAIHLGVPLWYANRANAIEPGSEETPDAKRLYRVTKKERRDENTGEAPQPLLFRRINARILLESGDHADLETLPILKIAHATDQEASLPQQDPAFIPPCLVLGGSETLLKRIRDLANQVVASRQALSAQLTKIGFSFDTARGAQLEQILRLRTLGRYAGILPQLVRAPAATPLDAYLVMRELLGELAALLPAREFFDVPDYDHDNPALAFSELDSRIRDLLQGPGVRPYLNVELARERDIFVAPLADEHFTRPNEYFLAIATNEDPRQVADLVEDSNRFRLTSRASVRRPLRGVKLAEDRAPVGLPFRIGLHYFKLLRTERVSAIVWNQIKAEKAIAAVWGGAETSDYKMTLYMTLPD